MENEGKHDAEGLRFLCPCPCGRTSPRVDGPHQRTQEPSQGVGLGVPRRRLRPLVEDLRTSEGTWDFGAFPPGRRHHHPGIRLKDRRPETAHVDRGGSPVRPCGRTRREAHRRGEKEGLGHDPGQRHERPCPGAVDRAHERGPETFHRNTQGSVGSTGRLLLRRQENVPGTERSSRRSALP
ncbi:hypothetical protein SDC9_78165 [bioreactor metagenome]|uniref:Uncharacterized protein n=1 Tax=bioreactor metagenome TaxID=1076179 RepID=A0A644YTG5_9ZZZZ